MVINDEIIAAYIEGKLSDSENLEVMRYLAEHPEERAVVLSLMDKWDIPQADQNVKEKSKQSQSGKTIAKIVGAVEMSPIFSFSFMSAAAFAPMKENEKSSGNPAAKRRQDILEEMKRRDDRLLDLWNDLEQTDNH